MFFDKNFIFPDVNTLHQFGEKLNKGFYTDFKVVHIPETALASRLVGPPLVASFSSNVSHELTFSMTNCQRCMFGVDGRSGQIYLRKSGLDFESHPQHRFNVTCRSHNLIYIIHVLIKVDDIIDEVPVFEHSMQRISVKRNFPIDTNILTLKFYDKDLNDAHRLNISSSSCKESLFSIDQSTNTLVLNESLKDFKSDSITLSIVVTDLAGLSDVTLIHIDIISENQYLPSHNMRYRRQAEISDGSQETSILLIHNDESHYFNSMVPSTAPFTIQSSENTLVLVILELQLSDGKGSGLKPESSRNGFFNFSMGSGDSNCPETFQLTQFNIEEEGIPFEIRRDHNLCQHVLTNTELLDYEAPDVTFSYLLTIQATYNDDIVPYRAYVRIQLIDQNDNVPYFTDDFISVSFLENFVGTIAQIRALDDDRSLKFSQLAYSIIGGSSDFELMEDGSIVTLRPFDYESDPQCYFFNISAEDGGGLTEEVAVEACLVDTDDNCPKLEREFYDFVVEENNPIGYVLLNLTAVDSDKSPEYSSDITYNIEPPSVTTVFRINTSERTLHLRISLDYDLGQRLFAFQIITSDSGGNSCSTNITVTVLNIRDIPPVFGFSFKQLRISEETYPYQSPDYPDNNIISCFSATDPEGDNVTYFLGNPSDYFHLLPHEEGACLMLLKPFDYESENRFEVEIAATDGNVYAESAFIIIDVGNVNDLALKVNRSYVIQVEETYVHLFPILNITVENPTPQTRYSFKLDQTSPLFSISERGSVILLSALDYETRQVHSINVRVSDGRNTVLSRVEIQVIPVNEFPPTFPPFRNIQRSLNENSPPGTQMYDLAALDSDSRSSVFYELEYSSIDGEPYTGDGDGDGGYNATTSPFAITQPSPPDSIHGTVVTTIEFDYEFHPREYVMIIYANDGKFRSIEPLVLTVFIEDVNDFAPQFSESEYTFMISETQDNLRIPLSATDHDGTAQYNLVTSYTIKPIYPLNTDVPFFGSGGLIRNTRRFDFEIPPNEYRIMLIAEDDYGLTGSTNVTFIIEDANEDPPLFDYNIYEATIPETLNVSSFVIQVNAEDSDGGPVFGSVQYHLQPIGGSSLSDLPYAINETTGEITLSSTVDYDIGQEGSDFYVVAKDGGGMMTRTRVYVSIEDVNDNSPCPLTRGFVAQIAENLPRSQPLRRIQVFEKDYDAINPRTIFYMEPTYDLFTIDGAGRIYMRGTFDYEERTSYSFDVIVSDGIQNCTERNTSVRIDVINSDDNRPEFTETEIVYNLTETTEPGAVLSILAVDADPPDTIVGYRLSSVSRFSTELPFVISSEGEISSTRFFDADDLSESLMYSMEAVAFNQYSHNTVSPARITINIIDVNDHEPVFEHGVYLAAVFENFSSDSIPVLIVNASDADRTSVVLYNMSVPDDEMDGFSSVRIDPMTGEVFITNPLDYEIFYSNYSLNISATDGVYESTAILVLEILDVNEFRPNFLNDAYQINIPLRTSLGSMVYEFMAEDEDGGEVFGTVSHYEMIRNSIITHGKFPFSLLPNGTLLAIVSEDEFVEDHYTFGIKAYDGANLSSPIVNVTVGFRDYEIDSLPAEHCMQILENSLSIDPIIDFSLYEGEFKGLYSYRLVNAVSFLSLINSSLYLGLPLDYEASQSRVVEVIASNRLGDDKLITVSLCVENVNDNPTNFAVSDYSLILNDNSQIGPQLYVELRDRDNSQWNLPVIETPTASTTTCCGRNYHNVITDINFTLSNPNIPFGINFIVDETSAYAVVSNLIGVAQMTSCAYSFLVDIMDTDGLFSITPLSLNVQVERNPVGPPSFLQSSYTFTTPENTLSQFSVQAHHVLELNACINSSLSTLEYSIVTTLPEAFPFEVDNDGVITTLGGPLDSESLQERYDFSVVATNKAGHSSQVPVTIYIQDVNEYCPDFNLSSTEFRISEGTGLREIFSQSLAFDNDRSERYNRITYSLESKSNTFFPFELSTDGSLYVSSSLDYESGRVSFDFNVTITDGGLNDTDVLGVRCGVSMTQLHVVVLDINDETPYFERVMYSFSTLENTSNDSVVGKLEFSDPDRTDNAFKLYTESDVPFLILDNGDIVLVNELDYEDPSDRRFNFLVYLTDGVQTALRTANVTVHVINLNEHKPVFSEPEYSMLLRENSIPPDGILRVSASDQDSGSLGKITLYELQDPLFTIDADGTIRNIREFDFEMDLDEFNMVVSAYDGGERVSSVNVQILIYDENDNFPVFDEDLYAINITEAATVSNVTLLTVHATDGDKSGKFNNISYSIVDDGACSSSFDIHITSGVIRVARPIDFETEASSCQLLVSASDPYDEQSITKVNIQILDSNEFKPVVPFEGETLEIIIHEALVSGDLVYRFQAYDDDLGAEYGSIVNYTIIPITLPLPFIINEAGELYLTQRLLQYSSYNFEVYAIDGGGLKSEGVMVDLKVAEANFSPPNITSSPSEVSFTVRENTVLSQPIWYLNATDEDRNDLVYVIIVGPENVISLDQISSSMQDYTQALVWLNQSLDFETRTMYRFEIAVYDGFYTSKPAILNIQVSPVNEYRPYFQKTYTEIAIPENAPPYTYQIEVAAFDLDRDDEQTSHGFIKRFYILEGSPFFTIVNLTESGTAVVTNTQLLDYETVLADLYIIVQVVDGGDLVASEPHYFRIYLTDANDNAPQFLLGSRSMDTYIVDIPENYVGVVLEVLAVDRDRSIAFGTVNYHLSGEASLFFKINASGVVRM